MQRIVELALVFWLAGGAAVAGELDLSDSEWREVDARLERFYSSPDHDPGPLVSRIPKFSVNENRWKPYSARFRKDTEAFQKAYCENVLKRRFPALYEAQCQGAWAAIESKDRVESLASGWVESGKLVHGMDDIPTFGKTAVPLWSDDYWRTRWGLTSFRYSEYNAEAEFETYQNAISAYAQPKEWMGILAQPIAEVAARTLRWSPAEKYDLAIGDEKFRLTKQQKEEGADNLGPDGNVAEWMGICHGWAAAATVVAPAVKSAAVIGSRGNEITFYPADIRALVSLHWANGNYDSNFIGGRCNAKEAALHPNGRIKSQACFDSNPATFHLVLGNLIGKHQLSFVMDKTFDLEVWNQPVHSYKVKYFNPLRPSEKNNDWRKVAVDYDNTFKAADRFQSPKTRGVRKTGGYDDSSITKVVGVIAAVTYVVEASPPKHAPEPEATYFERETYTYDLELTEKNGQWIPTGGEWHENSHPDFMWIPRRNDFAKSEHDDEDVIYTGSDQPSRELTRVAVAAAKAGLPLCRVVKELQKRSTGADTYRCE